MIKAIFFDFDGVLTLNERGSTITTEIIRESTPDLPISEIQDCYSRFHQELLLGAKDHGDIWSAFCQCVGKDVNSDILIEAFSRTPMNEEMIQLASELATDYRLGIITDNAADRMAFLIDKHNLDILFDPIVISAKVGKLKDEAEIFKNDLKPSGYKPGECVFIDNQKKYLIVPAVLGFKTYLFDPKQNDVPGLRRQFAEWGIRVK